MKLLVPINYYTFQKYPIFAKCIVTNSDVREEIEPMVALLVTYAQARLTETEQ